MNRSDPAAGMGAVLASSPLTVIAGILQTLSTGLKQRFIIGALHSALVDGVVFSQRDTFDGCGSLRRLPSMHQAADEQR